MDSESLKSIGSFLLWGGVIFLMMRYGCGAHMMGRHRGHGSCGKDRAAPDGNVRDPVCGMSVNPENAAAATVRGGTTHYFCSVSCRDKFEQLPELIADESTPGGHQHG
ncbi:MAG: YHS domain-containing protein [Betaproteobacteria bacterium]|nr:YHS domain-containing protein [Betaproteobacteria bacterium]